MNKQYIKRQITLYKLGIPMDKDIQEYYDYFHHLISDITKIKDSKHNRRYPNSIIWERDGRIILEYHTLSKCFLINNDVVWEKFNINYDMDYNKISELLSGLLEEKFKVYVKSTLCSWG